MNFDSNSPPCSIDTPSRIGRLAVEAKERDAIGAYQQIILTVVVMFRRYGFVSRLNSESEQVLSMDCLFTRIYHPMIDRRQ